MLKAKKGLLILGFLLILATVTALEVRKTEFVITTNPYLNLSISVIDPDTKEEVELFEGRARKFGEFRFTYYGIVDKVSLEVRAINNESGELIKEEKYGPYNLGVPTVNFNFTIAEEVKETEVVEESLPETTQVSSEEANEKSPILGLVIGEDGQFRKVYYYVFAGALGVIVLVILMRKRLAMKSGPTEPNPSKIVKKKVVPTKTEVPAQVVDKSNESNINDTEKKIADLQKQLEQIRNEEKLAKLQKQLNLEKQSLKRLQDETNPPAPQNQDSQKELPKF
ncbi:hypothetical protein FJZ21_01470 [Candidatus Pacearchaeota archaeon]|nr:hypothetical protein [Candidatus Pacearchaeota archaeon]